MTRRRTKFHWMLIVLAMIGGGYVLYLVLAPVPIEPIAWHAPGNRGYEGPFAVNSRLANLETVSLGGDHGAEDLVVDADGTIVTATEEGRILALRADRGERTVIATTGGRPLGIERHPDGRLIVADAYLGLLAVGMDGTIETLATEADGIPIRYANSVAVAADGRIVFTDASTKFGARESGGTYEASLLDLMEHGGHGRLLVWNPATGRANTLADGLQFANGVALAPDDRFVLVAETGLYRVLKVPLDGLTAGKPEVLIDRLPGFPDNLSRGLDGRFWVALVSPRNALLDALAGEPRLRKVIQRLPAAVRPEAVAYSHAVAFDADGRILLSLQDPEGGFPLLTGVTETSDALHFGSLVADHVARLPASAAGL